MIHGSCISAIERLRAFHTKADVVFNPLTFLLCSLIQNVSLFSFFKFNTNLVDALLKERRWQSQIEISTTVFFG